MWSSGGQLLYQREHSELMVAPYTTSGESIRMGRSVPWTQRELQLRAGIRNFDLHPDGERIALLLNQEDSQGSNNAIVVLNFFEVIRERLASQ